MATVGKSELTDDGFAWVTATLAAVSDAVVAVDTEGHLLLLNAPAESILGLDQAAAQGRLVESVWQMTHEKTGQPLASPVREVLKTETAVATGENCCLRNVSGRQFLIEGIAQPVRNARGSLDGVLFVFRDLAARRRQEESLRLSQKSEMIGHFRDGISHELNNLLTVVIGFSDVLIAKLGRDHALAGYLDSLNEIKSAAQKAALLTQQILSMGRSRLVQPTLVNLNDLLSSMEKTLARIVGERIRITIELARDLPLILIDPLQLMQIIFQLCQNARDAITQTGEIRLTTRSLQPTVGGGAASYPRVELSVVDNGAGMDAETLARARELFFTTKSENRGIGLPVVDAIVRAAGGEMAIESDPARGTSVTLSIPADVMQPNLPLAATKSAPAPTPPAGGTILLVEDADRVRRLLARVLEDAGYVVYHAANGRAGLELCREHDGKIQLLISDVMMPEMSGPELVKSLTNMKLMPRVLFLSGYAGDELERQGLDPGRYHFLQKPFQGEALLKKVREVLSSDRTE
jgi:PAS domain S-box-containing protein